MFATHGDVVTVRLSTKLSLGENWKIFIKKTLEARHKTFNSVKHRIVGLYW